MSVIELKNQGRIANQKEGSKSESKLQAEKLIKKSKIKKPLHSGLIYLIGYTLKLAPQPQVVVAFGLETKNLAPSNPSV